jgi:hypothetical protein
VICALVLDLPGPREFTVERSVLGRTLAVYPLMAAKQSHYVERTYLATESPDVKAVALQYDAVIVDAAEAPGPEAQLEKAYPLLAADLKREDKEAEFVVVMPR